MINNKKVVATVEARMSSSRLEGKVLMPLAEEPALKRLTDRLRPSKHIDEIVIATTINKKDRAIIDFCNKYGIKYYRGSENDVLGRVLRAAWSVNAEIIIEITGDCPLVDYRIVDQLAEVFGAGAYDYVANTIERSYPDGLDVQIFPVSVLVEVDKLADDPVDRVHVSSYIYTHPERFRLRNLKAEGKMYWPDLGITLDEEADYKLINIIFENLLPTSEFFSAEDIVDFLRDTPDLLEINKNVRRKKINEG